MFYSVSVWSLWPVFQRFFNNTQFGVLLFSWRACFFFRATHRNAPCGSLGILDCPTVPSQKSDMLDSTRPRFGFELRPDAVAA
jgi:hypothetical protein